MFLLMTQWMFNKGIHEAKPVAGLQLFHSLGVVLHCPANGHLSHLIFNMYLLCIVLMCKIFFSFISETLYLGVWQLLSSALLLYSGNIFKVCALHPENKFRGGGHSCETALHLWCQR